MAAPDTTFVDIRLSHLLRDCSVGAIVRHDKALMAVEDTRRWDGPNTSPYDREIMYVDLVKQALGLGCKKLCRPPVRKRVLGKLDQGWVPALRFPEWTSCSRCGLLHNKPWRKRVSGESAGKATNHAGGEGGTVGTGDKRQALDCKAQQCDGLLEQVSWLFVHGCGYLADVPWHAIAHSGSGKGQRSDCRPDWVRPYLVIENREGRPGVKCLRCGARARIPDRFRFGPKTRQQPWIETPPPKPPEEEGLLVRVNDVRVHFAECRTALVIPPESRIRRGSVVDRLYGNSADRKSILAAKTVLARKSRIRTLAAKYLCRPQEVETALSEIADGYPLYGRPPPNGELSQLEYRALTEPIPDLHPDEDFVTEHPSRAGSFLEGALAGRSAGIAAALDRLVAVHRIKEIMVFDGFRRAWGSGPVTPPHVEGESDWLPALELWGEGLFFTLREDAVSRWESQEAVCDRAAAFVQRAADARLPDDVASVLSPRFLLCHTLAHLIIRRLEAYAGYPAASLKERIYCDDGADEAAPMAGILIYVAVADEHGSLGGLMDLAQPSSFLRLLTGAVEDASWCSFDPVCADQEGHGPDLLNRAACHGCVLVPESSCICGNRLLDRAFVHGGAAGLRSLWDVAGQRVR